MGGAVMQGGDGLPGHYRQHDEDDRRGIGRRRSDTEAVERMAVVETKLGALEERMEADTAALRGDIARIDDAIVRVHERIDDLSDSINRQMQHAEKVMGDMLGRHEKAEGAIVDAKIATALHPLNESIRRIEVGTAHRSQVVEGIAADIASFKEFGAALGKWALRGALMLIGVIAVATGSVIGWYVSNYEWITRLVEGLQKLAGVNHAI